MIIKHAPPDWGIPLSNPTIRNYMINWVSILFIAVVLAFIYRKRLAQNYSGYFDFLFLRWKVLTFSLSGLFVSFAGYWTDDESWDVISGFGMSFFTFLVAPLAVGIVVRFISGREKLLPVFLALVFSFFSFSWFYDGYLVLRDGTYTQRWAGNLLLSGIIYLCAGYFWNLELTPQNKISFGFSRLDWPKPPANKKAGKVFLFAIPIGLVALFFIVGFVGWSL